VDLGPPGDWGPDCVLVVDSLSRLCDAAYDFRLPLAVKGKGGEIDLRAVYGDAQDAIENNLANLTSDEFRTNVIVIAHIVYQETPDGMKGFPQGVGQKLSPKIPQYFPTVVRYFNKGGKRTIKTGSTPLIDLANPKPFDMADSYEIGTGLAEIFEVLRGKGPEVKVKPALRRV
ncbi:MAG: ATP-binding protein, partial [Acidobacteriia bacterium]|nr:ATP-binding protein [Terriglobia bacterium]